MMLRIIDVRRIPALGPGRAGEIDTIVTAMVDGKRPILVSIPKSNPAEHEIKEILAKEAKETETLIGKEFSL